MQHCLFIAGNYVKVIPSPSSRRGRSKTEPNSENKFKFLVKRCDSMETIVTQIIQIPTKLTDFIM